jgi:hypothetical protein
VIHKDTGVKQAAVSFSWTIVLLAVSSISQKTFDFSDVIDEFASVKARKFTFSIFSCKKMLVLVS